MGPVTLLWIVLGVLVLLAVLAVALYNGLVARRNRFKNAFAQIDVQLKRRHDLIPNVVETVKAYMKHEREALESVTRARTEAEGARVRAAADPADGGAVVALAAAEGTLGASLGRLLGLKEAYPELKANRSAELLMEELVTTENRIAFARQAFNDMVMGYNTAREVFPGNLVAGMFGFRPAALFELSDEAIRAVPRASLS